MAINPSTEQQYQGAVNAPDSDYPFGSARNDASPGDLTGTPRVANEVNDWLGFSQSVLDRNGDAPNGAPDSVTNPQILDALLNLATDLTTPVTVPVSGKVYTISGQGDSAEYVPPAGATEVTYTILCENADPETINRLTVYTRTSNGFASSVESKDQLGRTPFGVEVTHTTKLPTVGASTADRVEFYNRGTTGGVPATLVRVQVLSYTIAKGKM